MEQFKGKSTELSGIRKAILSILVLSILGGFMLSHRSISEELSNPTWIYFIFIIIFIFSILYILIFKVLELSGDLEDDAFQIIIRDKEIKSIAPSRGPITINADEILDLKFSRQKGGLIKFKLKDYRKLAGMGFIERNMLYLYQKNKPWLGFPVPELSKEDRKRLMEEVEMFKKRNHIGVEKQR